MTCMEMLWNGCRTITHQIIFLTSVNQIFIMVLILKLKKNTPYALQGEVLGEDCMMPEHLKVYDQLKDMHLLNGPVPFK